MMTNKTQISSEKYLVLRTERGKSFKPIKDEIKNLGGFYNGLGYSFAAEKEQELRQLTELLDVQIITMPLTKGQTFEQLKLSHTTDFLRTKLYEAEKRIDLIVFDNNLENCNEDEIREKNIPEDVKENLLQLFEEREQLTKNLEWADGMEKTLAATEKSLSIVSMEDRIKAHNDLLNLYRGKKYLGLCVKTITEFNEKMKGLRKLILLAAAPNVGKTALTVQLAEEVLSIEDDACLVYLSLEMTADEIFTRINLCLSGLDFDTYVLGKEQTENEKGKQPLFSKKEITQMEEATTRLKQIGDRLQIIDSTICPTINSDSVIEYIKKLKTQTNCSRVIVIVDYLQVWPLPENKRFSSDVEADKWRIGEIKKIKDFVNETNQDPVIVISEARKPSSGNAEWGEDLSDVMGSARGTYTPDVVLLLSALQPKQVADLWDKKGMPKITYKENADENKDEKDPNNIRGFLAHHGMALCNLKMPKARDGMKKFNTILTFNFYKNRFAPVDWLEIKTLVNRYNNNNSKVYPKDEDGNEIIADKDDLL